MNSTRPIRRRPVGRAGAGAIFNLLSNALRPSGWTSTDAAGLPVFPGLVRYDEIAAGEIRHAIRFTVPQTQRAFVWPARHYASSLTGTQYPPMGARFRLRAGFDISGFSAANQVILRALKKYGMILADNGSAWYLSGAPDSRWNNDDLHNLGLLHGSDFEAVDVSGLMIDPNSGQAAQSTTVSVTVSPSTASVQTNATKQFTATVTNATTQAVNWSVNGAPGGNSAVGLVSTTGLYTAPAVPPSGGTVTVQAASTVSPSAIGLRHSHGHLASRRAGADFDHSEQWNAGHERGGHARRVQLPARYNDRGERYRRLGDGRYGGQFHQADGDLCHRGHSGRRRSQRHRGDHRRKQRGPDLHSKCAGAGKAHFDVTGAGRGVSRRKDNGYAQRYELHLSGDGRGAG